MVVRSVLSSVDIFAGLQISCYSGQIHTGQYRNTRQIRRFFRVARVVDARNVRDGLVSLPPCTRQGITATYSVLRARSLKSFASTSEWPNYSSYVVILLQTYQEVLRANGVSLLQHINLKFYIILGRSAIHTSFKETAT
jgi:hypothetical protein